MTNPTPGAVEIERRLRNYAHSPDYGMPAQLMAEAADLLAALAAENAALVADARRYRFLRDSENSEGIVAFDINHWPSAIEYEGLADGEIVCGDELDKAVDAAIAHATEEGKDRG